MKQKARVDQMLVDRELAPSLSRAQALVLAGVVFAGDRKVDKPGMTFELSTDLVVRGAEHPFVSRGGVKLAGALDTFGVDVKGLRCLDLGSSTGGFTDCLLLRGASGVVAVDVGYGLLAHKLRVDPRVVVMERTNGRTLQPEDIGGEVDLSVVDASFIGLPVLLPALARCTRQGGTLVALIKPQFEVGAEEASKGKGVVRDEALREATIEKTVTAIAEAGFEIVAQCNSSLPGPKGNVEAFAYGIRRVLGA